MRIARAAAAGCVLPCASAETARVASVPARVKRVGARKSRTSSHWRAAAASPRRASATAPVSPARSSVVQAAARARASSRASPPAAPRARASAARRSRRSRCGELQRNRPQRRVGSRDERAGALRVTEYECGLRRTEVAPRVDGAGPPCGRTRARGRRCHRGGGECCREERSATHRYCWISTPSCAACCETWPATASPRACASVPSWSACSGVNRRPPCSCARRSPMKALSSSSSLPV